MERSGRSWIDDAKLARSRTSLLFVCLIAACQSESVEPTITYTDGPPLGDWSSPIVEGGQGGMAGVAGVTAMSGGSGPSETGGTSGVDSGTGRVDSSTGGVDSGTGGVDSGIGGSAGTVAVGLSSLAFDVLTHSQGGKYSPRNIGAIWIETSGGDFVKTLEVWAERRASHLMRWKNEAGSSRVDAVSGATLRSHVAHSVTWDLSDASGNIVDAGDYKLVIEATDREAAGASQEIEFSLGAEPQTITPADGPAFSSMSLTLE